SNQHNHHHQQIITQTKLNKPSLIQLFQQILQPQNQLKPYIIQKQLIKPLHKHPNKIPTNHPPLSPLLNPILPQPLLQYPILQHKQENKK
ncbi:hypothetical protein, partial [Bacillus thuringiensis]|uniref:hypothetical protein n=1 Tax=Bacillus thuringiensis TaxID=1428 RepID=UPI001C930A29